MTLEKKLYNKIKSESILHSFVLNDFLLALSEKHISYDLPRKVDFEDLSAQEQTAIKNKFNAQQEAACIESLKKIIDFWENDGFTNDPKDLFEYVTTKDINKNIKEKYSAETYKNFLKEHLEIAFAPDKSSGFAGKSSGPLIMALSCLYKEIYPKTSLCLINIDIANLGATNELIKKQMNDGTNGFQLSDKAVSVALNIYIDSLQKELKDIAHIKPYRIGGDEYGISITSNIFEDDFDLKIKDALEEADQIAEEFIHSANLHDMEHPKYPNDKTRKGMFVGHGQTYVQTNDTPATIIESLEASLIAGKIIQGHARQGLIPSTTKKGLINFIKTHDEYKDPQLFVNGIINKTKIMADRMKKFVSNVPAAQYLDNMPDKWRKYYSGIKITSKSSIPYSKDERDPRKRTQGPIETFIGNTIVHFKNTGVQINDYSINFLKNFAKVFIPKDAASGAFFADNILQATTDRYYQDAINDPENTNLNLPHIVGIEMGGLQALNGFLGNEYSNQILKDIVNITKETLDEYGIKNKDDVFTTNGGFFYFTLPGIVHSKNKSEESTPITTDVAKEITNKIKEKTNKQINNKSIIQYLKDNKIPFVYSDNSETKGILRLPDPDNRPIVDPKTNKELCFKDILHPRKWWKNDINGTEQIEGIRGVEIIFSMVEEIIPSDEFVSNFMDEIKSTSMALQTKNMNKLKASSLYKSRLLKNNEKELY